MHALCNPVWDTKLSHAAAAPCGVLVATNCDR